MGIRNIVLVPNTENVPCEFFKYARVVKSRFLPAVDLLDKSAIAFQSIALCVFVRPDFLACSGGGLSAFLQRWTHRPVIDLKTILFTKNSEGKFTGAAVAINEAVVWKIRAVANI